MTRFKIQVVTKQNWVIETDVESAEKAKEIRDKLYETIQAFFENNDETIHDTILMDGVLAFENQSEDKFYLDEFFGGDDLSDDDIENLSINELPEAERASKTAVYSLFVTCPHCGSETEYNDESEEYGRICSDIDNDGVAVITCPDCGEKFRQISYKEY